MTAIIEGPTFAGPAALEVRFWYHMFNGSTAGQQMGTLSLDVSTDQGTTWTNAVWIQFCHVSAHAEALPQHQAKCIPDGPHHHHLANARLEVIAKDQRDLTHDRTDAP